MNFLSLIDWFALAPRDGSRSLWKMLLILSIVVSMKKQGVSYCRSQFLQAIWIIEEDFNLRMPLNLHGWYYSVLKYWLCRINKSLVWLQDGRGWRKQRK